MQAADGGDQRLTFAFGQATGDFVQEQQLWPRCHCAGKFKALAVQQRQRPGKLVGADQKLGVVQDRDASLLYLGLALVLAESGGGQQVFKHRQPLEGLRDLKAAAYAHADAVHRRKAGHVLAKEGDLAGIGQDVARDQVEKRGFSRAVRADDAQRLTLRHRKRNVIGHLEGAEGL